VALLDRHYRSLFRRQWDLVAVEGQPHFFDHRHDAFPLLAGRGGAAVMARGFLASEILRVPDILLDIGCGDGFFDRQFFAERCAHIDAIDIEMPAIRHARRYNAAPNIAYHVLDAVNQPFPRERYDVVIWDSALGHFAPETTDGVLAKITDALDPGGAFVGSESLGDEGWDHLQHFASLDDIAAVLGAHFPYVQVRSMTYSLAHGRGVRREAFWRCAFSPQRLDATAWSTHQSAPS
jgi:SAM-dependent methyltransferase